MKQACFKPGCYCTLEHNMEKLPGASGRTCSRCGHYRFRLRAETFFLEVKYS